MHDVQSARGGGQDTGGRDADVELGSANGVRRCHEGCVRCKQLGDAASFVFDD